MSKHKKKQPRYNWKVHSLCGVVFLLSIFFVSFDKPWSDYIHWESRLWHSWVSLITHAGDGWFLLAAALIFSTVTALRERKQRRSARALLWRPALLSSVSFLLCGLVLQVLKFLFGRPRPFLYDDIANHHLSFSKFYWLHGTYDFTSFPSGHSAAIFSVAWIIVRFTEKRSVRILAIAIASLAALTRVMLGKHYLADIFAGAALGIASSQLLVDLYNQDK